MPVFKAEIFKDLGVGRKPWSSTYHLFAADMSVATAAVIDDLLPAEQDIHATYVRFPRVRVSTQAPADGQFVIIPTGLTGSHVASTGSLPLWNCYLFNFSTDTGRPSKKYMRSPVLEGEQEGGALEPVTITRLNADYANRVFTALINVPLDSPHLVDVDGQRLMTCTVDPEVHMRQLYRVRRRRTTSGPPVV